MHMYVHICTCVLTGHIHVYIPVPHPQSVTSDPCTSSPVPCHLSLYLIPSPLLPYKYTSFRQVRPAVQGCAVDLGGVAAVQLPLLSRLGTRAVFELLSALAHHVLKPLGGGGGGVVGHCALWTTKVGGEGGRGGHCALWTTKVGGRGGV